MPWIVFKAIGTVIISVMISVGAAIASIIPLLIGMWIRIMGVFKVAALAVARVGEAVWSFVKPVWTKVLRPIVETLLDFWEQFRALLNKILTPILDAVQWVTDLVLRLYDNYIQPILDWLENARLVFTGLGMLGVGWAQKVADAISRVQNAINETFGIIVEYLYNITNIINDLLDPGGWFKAQVWFLTVRRWAGGSMSILVGLGVDENLDLRRAQTAATVEIPTIPMVRDKWKTMTISQHPAVRRVVLAFKEGRLGESSSLV